LVPVGLSPKGLVQLIKHSFLVKLYPQGKLVVLHRLAGTGFLMKYILSAVSGARKEWR